MICWVIILMIIGIAFVGISSFSGGEKQAKSFFNNAPEKFFLSVGLFVLALAGFLLYCWNISIVGGPGRLSGGVVYRLISQTPTEDGKNLVTLQNPDGDYYCVLSPDGAFADSVHFAKVSVKTDWHKGVIWELIAVMPFDSVKQPNTTVEKSGKTYGR